MDKVRCPHCGENEFLIRLGTGATKCEYCDRQCTLEEAKKAEQDETAN